MNMPEQVIERDFEEVAKEAYLEQDNAEKGLPPTPKQSSTPKDDDEAGQPDADTDEPAKGTDEDGEGAKGEDDKADEGDKDEKPPEDLDKKITDHAEKHRLTYAEAKEDLEKTEEIIKQYKNDPAEMARAMRNKDREYQKLRAEAEKAAVKKEPPFRRMTDDQFRDFARKKVGEMPDYVEKYRAKFPAKSENMSDEAIVEEIVERELMIYGEKATQKEVEIKEGATKKRADIIASLPEADRRFIPEIKALLAETDDASVLSDGFDIKDALYWAKGKAYDADIKAAEERALKRLKESPEIIGTKGGGSSKPQGGKTTGLTDNQKQRAVEMFGSDSDDEKCYEMFKDAYKEELKKNSKFDPYKD
jgi:hypothetical protein